jgi:hypothetical protein
MKVQVLDFGMLFVLNDAGLLADSHLAQEGFVLAVLLPNILLLSNNIFRDRINRKYCSIAAKFLLI